MQTIGKCCIERKPDFFPKYSHIFCSYLLLMTHYFKRTLMNAFISETVSF